MKFSIVIPVFKTEQFLPRCLDSLITQTDGDFEVVVVDDCSPGQAVGSSCPPYQAEQIASRYDDRFRYIRHEKNRSAFQARCTGVAAAKGDYVVPVDPDDYLLPETLAKLREVIERDDPDVVSYWIDCEVGRKIWPHWCRHPAGAKTTAETLHEIAHRKANYSIVSKTVRRTIYQQSIERLQLPADAYVNTSEDFLAMLAILLCSNRVVHLDYAGYRYVSNPTSITGARRSANAFRHACEQTRFVHDAIRALATRVGAGVDTLACLNDIIEVAERFFCTEVIMGRACGMSEGMDILLASFRPQIVAHAFAEEVVTMRGSRAYRVGKMLSRAIGLLIGKSNT